MSAVSRRRSAGLFVMFSAVSACGKRTNVTERAVTVHAPQACAADGNAYATYQALGDFEPPAPSTGHLLSRVGEELGDIDGAARSLVVGATEGDRQWFGVGEVPMSGDVDVLVLPWLQSCPLSAQVGSRSGPALGVLGGSRVLIVGGVMSADAGAAAGTPATTHVVHLDTGEEARVLPDLLTPRTQATVTAFGDGGLVAGGFDATSGAPIDRAEVYESALQGFDQQHPILLSRARAAQGAVVLATGETLLVGGVGDGGKVLDAMEIVDPLTRTVRAENVARLAVARQAPAVLRLASGEILVAGGRDGAGNPVTTVEWFSADASSATKRARDLVAGAARSYAALDAGGALAVIAPPPGAAAGFQSVWVIDADGSFEPATPVPGALVQPTLLGGAGGAPALWTGSLWLRWQPWAGAFGALGVLDDAPAQVSDATASPDPGLALWLDDAAQKTSLLRFDVRGVYSTVPEPLVVADASNMAPDRLASPDVAAWDPSLGLVLGPGASAFVTDRTYAGFTADLDAPTGDPALVVLRDDRGNELEVGGGSCPGALVAPGSASSLHVERTGSSVLYRASTGASGTCNAILSAGARVSVGVRAPLSAGRSVIRDMRIARVRPR